jgi:hypothetical protein
MDPGVSSRGWVILTKDKNIRRRHGEREAVLTSNARIITLSSGNMTGAEMSTLFVGRLGEMEALASGQAPPFVAVLAPDGLKVVIAPPSSPGENAGPEPDGSNPEQSGDQGTDV